MKKIYVFRVNWFTFDHVLTSLKATFMTLDEVTEKLRALKFNQVRKGWSAKDTHGDETYGLNFSKVQQVAKDINNDPCLADELYASSNHDLKVLATFIDDPGSYTRDELEKRSAQLYPSPFSEKFCQNVIARSAFAVQFIDKWIHSNEADLKVYAFDTLAELAKHKNNLGTDFFAQYLQLIAEGIDNEPKEVQVSMCKAVNSIGSRDECLQQKCAMVSGVMGADKARKANVNKMAGHSAAQLANSSK